MRCEEIKPGEWVQPVRKGYKLRCCDCGLVHRMDFRVVVDKRGSPRAHFRVFRDNRATAACRRKKDNE
jgi:Zn-finger protein